MSKTIDDLKAAFAGESQANRKYLAFARKAEGRRLPSNRQAISRRGCRGNNSCP